MLSKNLKVFLYDEPIGTLAHLPGDKNFFAFDESYIANPSRPTLSLSFKDVAGDLMTNLKMTQTRLPPFFSNLLPEGPLRDYLAMRARVHPEHEFFLLSVLGKDLPGAMTIRSADLYESPSEISSSVQETEKKTPLRFSLAGVQLKFSAIAIKDHGLVIPANGVGGKWIVKLPHSIYQKVPENEYTMMELARKIGIDVPQTALHPIEELEGLPRELKQLGGYVFAIQRFDRTSDGKLIHIEDFAQVFGVYPEKKYKVASYRNIAEVLWKEAGKKEFIEFLKRFVFNALIGNGDMHLKNWSLIYREKRKPSLAPAYDFICTIPYLPEDELALSFAGRKDFASLTLGQFSRFAAKIQVPEGLVLDTVKETVEAFSKVWKEVGDLPLDQEVKRAIEGHLKTIPIWK